MIKSPLLFNGFNRLFEPGATYKHPTLPSIELKIEEDISQINDQNPFSIYVPDQFNEFLGDAYDTDFDLAKFASQFTESVKFNAHFVFHESPGTVLTPSVSYDLRLLNRLQWYYIFVVDDAIEKLAAARDASSKPLYLEFLSNCHHILTGRSPKYD